MRSAAGIGEGGSFCGPTFLAINCADRRSHLADPVGNGAHLRGIAPRTDDEVIGNIGKLAEIEDQYVERFFTVRGFGAELSGFP